MASFTLAGDAAVADDRFTPPANADAGRLTAFIKRLAEPKVEFSTRQEANQYRRKAAVAIVKAAGKIVRGKARKDQLAHAIRMKAGSLQLLQNFKTEEAYPTPNEYLSSLLREDDPSVALSALELKVNERVQHWRTLGESEKSQLLDEIAEVIQRTPATVDHVRLLTFVADVLGDTAEREALVQLATELRPHFEASPQPEVNEKLAELDGVVRRLQLLGGPIEVEGQLLDGQPLDWEQYLGKVVLVDYWATWCGLCNAELPNLQELQAQYGEQGFVVLGISLDDDRERVKEFLAERDISWPVLFGKDPQSRGWDHPMVEKYGIHDLPRAILVDRDGHVISMNARGKQLAAKLGQLFDAPVAKEDGSANRVANAQ